MKRRILCLLLAAAMLLGSMTALAGELTRSARRNAFTSWAVQRTGTYADGKPEIESLTARRRALRP